MLQKLKLNTVNGNKVFKQSYPNYGSMSDIWQVYQFLKCDGNCKQSKLALSWMFPTKNELLSFSVAIDFKL